MNKKYAPIDPDYYEMISSEMSKERESVVHFFNAKNIPDTKKGKLIQLSGNDKNGKFLILQPKNQLRLDRIITLNGKPGPAYDEYDSFANACLDCMGGMEEA